jgi:hypothetical protein
MPIAYRSLGATPQHAFLHLSANHASFTIKNPPCTAIDANRRVFQSAARAATAFPLKPNRLWSGAHCANTEVVSVGSLSSRFRAARWSSSQAHSDSRSLELVIDLFRDF